MEKKIKERYSDQILYHAMTAFGIRADQIQILDGFESFIYEFDRDNKSYILRIGHSLRRSENLMRGEIDWINYLHQGGAGVSQAIVSEAGDLVIRIDDGFGECFLATAFEKACGSPPRKDDLGTGFYENYGRLLGKIHALTKTYLPAEPAWKRMEWDGPEMSEIQALSQESESVIIDKYTDLKRNLDALPKSRESYGLIHQDAHLGNLFVDEMGAITLFDFDDCTYSWFMNDIAIVLFYIALGQEDQAAFTKEFMTRFLRGYRLENQMKEEWLVQIPSFLKLREIDLYAVIHRSFDVDNLDDPWVANYMRDRKTRIENGVPFIDFDFGRLKFSELL
ncbi:MAG TPA: phosphotransferase [Anaerolineales bacterium]|nr:phosphotransferase [Anaerolineales bacterium]HUV27440.1 phosphotransferase [Anaerolineales bacterium]